MSLIELNELLNRDCKDNYNGGEYTTKILDRQSAFAEMFPQLISEVALNGISSQVVCPNLESYNTGVPSEEDFARYNSKLAERLREFEATSVGPEVLDVDGRTR